jgi:predicted nuclease of predicted toxin-antitoxin system
VKFLLDENLSPSACQPLNQEGIDICSVRDRGLIGKSDLEVLRYAKNEGRVVITLNIKDFLTMSKDEPHAGMILLENAEVDRAEQCAGLRRIVRQVAELYEDGSAFVVEADLRTGTISERKVDARPQTKTRTIRRGFSSFCSSRSGQTSAAAIFSACRC